MRHVHAAGPCSQYFVTWILQIPTIAFGTGSVWYGRGVTEYVEQALESGFDHIDTAASPYLRLLVLINHANAVA